MKKLGFGLMRLPVKGKIPTMVNLEEVKKMVDIFMENGFTYFDTAYIYHGLRSEPAARKALVERYDRDAFTLATKLPLVPVLIKNENDQDKIFKKQLSKCGVSYFDYYLIHNLGTGNLKLASRLNTFDYLQKNKDAGKIRNMGFSFHGTPELLDEILTSHPETDFVLLQINYLDWENDKVQSRRCYETAVKHGKKVVIMEPVKGGTLAKVPEAAEKLFKDYNPDASVASWAIRFAASLDNVIAVLSGMSTVEQVRDNVSYMNDFKPLSGEERIIIANAVNIIQKSIAVPCTSCGYCVDGCPKKIAIPDCFELFNAESQSSGKSAAQEAYGKLLKQRGKASDCIGCGQCERACPQHLDIPGYLRQVADTFEK